MQELSVSSFVTSRQKKDGSTRQVYYYYGSIRDVLKEDKRVAVVVIINDSTDSSYS